MMNNTSADFRSIERLERLVCAIAAGGIEGAGDAEAYAAVVMDRALALHEKLEKIEFPAGRPPEVVRYALPRNDDRIGRGR